jgi:hypothetical protein
MSFTRQVYLEVDGEKDLSLVMTYRNGERDPDSFEIEVFRSNESIGLARWVVDIEHYAFIFDPSAGAGRPSAASITKCLGLAVGNGLIACLWDANGDRQALRKGVKDAAAAVLLVAAGGIAGCL